MDKHFAGFSQIVHIVGNIVTKEQQKIVSKCLCTCGHGVCFRKGETVSVDTPSKAINLVIVALGGRSVGITSNGILMVYKYQCPDPKVWGTFEVFHIVMIARVLL